MEPMTEYESHDGDHHDAGTDSAANDTGAYGEHLSHHAETPADAPPIPDDPAFHHADDPELHFPGEHPHTGDDGWHDDDHFDRWLHEPHTPEDDTPDTALRDQLAPPDDTPGLSPADELVDWALRQSQS